MKKRSMEEKVQGGGVGGVGGVGGSQGWGGQTRSGFKRRRRSEKGNLGEG